MRLGGRQDVYVVDDPHRLLSESYVFKHTPCANAERDQQTILGFRQFLEAHNSPKHFGLPEPLRIARLSKEEAVYLMRKANGVQLGRLVIQQFFGGKPSPKHHFIEALQYLAHFHAWSGRKTGRPVRKMLVESFGKVMSLSLANRLASEVPTDWPLVRKKDAHPENWLRGASGEIIMLDFEAMSPCPLLLDVVQIDDYPLVTPDGSGWQERLEMVGGYFQQLGKLGYLYGMNPQIVERAFATLVTFRCAFGLHHQHRRDQNALERDSISGLRVNRVRAEHYRALLGFLHCSGPSENVRELAGAVLQDLSQTLANAGHGRTGEDGKRPEAFS
jgi:hypothetical protein